MVFNGILRAESRPNASIAVHRGPLHYAYDISRTQTVLAQDAEQPMAVDLEFDATAPWQYAIDPDTLVFNDQPPASGQLPSPVFDSGLPPYTITAIACPIEWEVAGDTFASPPPVNPTCTGPLTNITLWPYGVRTRVFLERALSLIRLCSLAGNQASHRRIPGLQLVAVWIVRIKIELSVLKFPKILE